MKKIISMLTFLSVLLSSFCLFQPEGYAENIKNSEIDGILKETVIVHEHLNESFSYGERVTEIDTSGMVNPPYLW